MKKYYNLKIGKPNVNGYVIALDTEEKKNNLLKDYIHPYTDEDMNLQFKAIKKNAKGTIYNIKIPQIETHGDGYIPGIVCVGPGWCKTGEDTAKLLLTDNKELKVFAKKTKQDKAIYLDEITAKKAKRKDDEETEYAGLMLMMMGY